jgi:hypothetical protein
MRRYVPLISFAVVLGLGSPALIQAQDTPSAPAARARADTVSDTTRAKRDTVDNSWPELECTAQAARNRRKYTDTILVLSNGRRDTVSWNANHLIYDQQRLADALACQKESDLVLRTGVDFTSADGFTGKNADLRASIAYNINIGGSWLPLLGVGRVSRLALTVRAERLSALVERSHFACTGSVEPRSPDAGQTTRLPENCALTVIGADSVTQTVFRPSPASFRPDDEHVRGTWNVSALTRYETPLFVNTNIVVGPALSVSFSTDPTGGASRGLVSSWLGGFSMRQFREIDADPKAAQGPPRFTERFSVLALWGQLHRFRENVYTYDSAFATAHPEVALMPGATVTNGAVNVEMGRSSQSSLGLSLQMMFQPVPVDLPNLFFRGAVDFPHDGRRSASLAVLLQGDLSNLLRGLGISSGSSK